MNMQVGDGATSEGLPGTSDAPPQEGLTEEQLLAHVTTYSGRDGEFSQAEFNALAEDFGMSPEEFAAFLGIDNPDGVSADEVTDKIFNEFNINNDGVISDWEWQQEEGQSLLQLRANFDEYDTDGDGLLSKRELQEIVDAGGPDAKAAQTLLNNFEGAMFGNIDAGTGAWAGISEDDLYQLDMKMNNPDFSGDMEDAIWENASDSWVGSAAGVEPGDTREEVIDKITAYTEAAQDRWGVQDDGLAGLFNQYSPEEIAFIEAFAAGEIDPETMTDAQRQLLVDYVKDAERLGLYEEDPGGTWFSLSPPGEYPEWVEPEFYDNIDFHRATVENVIVQMFGEGESQEDGSKIWQVVDTGAPTTDVGDTSTLENPGDNNIENALVRYNDGAEGKKRITRQDFIRNGWPEDDARMMQLLSAEVPNKDGHHFRTVDGVTLEGMEENGWIIVHDDGTIELTEAGRERGEELLAEDRGY